MTAGRTSSKQLQQSEFLLGNRTLQVSAPGSCANLGPGFDTLALAIDKQCTIKLSLAPSAGGAQPAITLAGAGCQAIPSTSDNLVFKILSHYWPLPPEFLPRLQLTIDSDIPAGRGLGSSAAASVAALYACQALLGLDIDQQLLLTRAQEWEGHADNACASLLGGLALVCAPHEGGGRQKAITARTIDWPSKWQLIVTVPDYQLSTSKARAVLPGQVPLSAAVANLQKLALLLLAAQGADDAALAEALDDRLHEPYRQHLVPELRQVRQALSGTAALGTVLSGAGCSVLTIVNERQQQQVLCVLNQWAQAQQRPPEIMPVRVCGQGVTCAWQ